jgi:hypothetical protein
MVDEQIIWPEASEHTKIKWTKNASTDGTDAIRIGSDNRTESESGTHFVIDKRIKINDN